MDYEEFEEHIGKECFLCGREFTERDFEKNNLPVRANNISGFVHRRCRGKLNKNLIQRPTEKRNLF